MKHISEKSFMKIIVENLTCCDSSVCCVWPLLLDLGNKYFKYGVLKIVRKCLVCYHRDIYFNNLLTIMKYLHCNTMLLKQACLFNMFKQYVVIYHCRDKWSLHLLAWPLLMVAIMVMMPFITHTWTKMDLRHFSGGTKLIEY